MPEKIERCVCERRPRYQDYQTPDGNWMSRVECSGRIAECWSGPREWGKTRKEARRLAREAWNRVMGGTAQVKGGSDHE